MGYAIAFILGVWFGIVLMALAIASGREERNEHNEGAAARDRNGDV